MSKEDLQTLKDHEIDVECKKSKCKLIFKEAENNNNRL